MDWSATSFACAQCGEKVQYGADTTVITIATANLTQSGMRYTPLVVDVASDHDFLYEPCYLCPGCCSAIVEQLDSITRDVVPITDDTSAIISCQSCTCGIQQGEVVGKLTAGEVHRSKRFPSGYSGGSTFVDRDHDPIILCVSCINRLNEDVVDELWRDPVQQHKECREGGDIRCWRTGCSADIDDPCARCNI